MTQTDAIINWMETHGTIDPLTALRELGCFRLGARIWDIRNAGIPVTGEIRTNPTTGKKYKVYWLEKEPLPAATGNDSEGGGNVKHSTSKISHNRLEVNT